MGASGRARCDPTAGTGRGGGGLLGRLWAYALAATGERGVAHVLQLIEAEMRVAKALTGPTCMAAIDRGILVQDGLPERR